MKHLSIIMANVLWGLYATVCKGFLMSGVVGSWALCGIKMLGGAALFWLLALLLPRPHGEPAVPPRRDLLLLLAASLLIGAANQSLIIVAMDYTSPLDGTVICSMAPIFTVLLAAVLLRHRIALWQAIGIAIGFAGALLFVFPATQASREAINPLLGDTLVVVSQICGALYLLLFPGLLQRYSAITLMKWIFLFSAIVLLPFTWSDIAAVEWTRLDMPAALGLAYIIIAATCLAYLLLIIGQKGVRPTTIAMYNYVQPVVAAISSIALGLTVLTAQNFTATLLCLTGVYIVTIAKPATPRSN